MLTRLPPFFSLRALEAAARHRSYSRAAEELAVTHGAVSQQIRKLEGELGARLFERRGNAMIPTPEAERLAGEVARALGILHNAVSVFARAAERDPLVVSIDPQFATRWLPARLTKLLADPAGANLEMRVDQNKANFVTDGVDVGIRYGAGQWEGLEATPLFSELLFPVCSPALAARFPMRTPQDLLQAPLLHHSHRPWSLWFGQLGIPSPEPSGIIFDDSVMLVEAAAQGLGVALGRDSIVGADLQAGRLVQPIAASVPSEFGMFVVWRPDSRKLPRIHALRDWLVEEAQGALAAEAA